MYCGATSEHSMFVKVLPYIYRFFRVVLQPFDILLSFIDGEEQIQYSHPPFEGRGCMFSGVS